MYICGFKIGALALEPLCLISSEDMWSMVSSAYMQLDFFQGATVIPLFQSRHLPRATLKNLSF